MVDPLAIIMMVIEDYRTSLSLETRPQALPQTHWPPRDHRAGL
jgi:hypothetical protein